MRTTRPRRAGAAVLGLLIAAELGCAACRTRAGLEAKAKSARDTLELVQALGDPSEVVAVPMCAEVGASSPSECVEWRWAARDGWFVCQADGPVAPAVAANRVRQCFSRGWGPMP